MKMQLIKTLFLLLSLNGLFIMPANSQSVIKNYSANWKKVDAFIEKGLPKSALTEVKNIYTLAKKEKQDAQIIKSLLYRISLEQENREDNEVVSIAELEKEISTTKGPAQFILKSLLAELYNFYLQEHRWQLYERSETVNFNKKNIATWSLVDFHQKIGSLYLESIKNEKLLQATKLEPYDALIQKGNVRQLRPTLFDLLAHRALGYFENDERDISNPAYAFEINLASAFDPAADFIGRKFPTKDSMSLQQKALLIYQQLIVFHLLDKTSDALIDVDIKRIEFVYANSTRPDKEKLYYQSLHHLALQYPAHPAAAQAWYLLAAFHNEKANQYTPYGDTAFRYERVKAKEICEQVLLQKTLSEGKVNASNLLQSINEKTLEFAVEKVNTPQQAFRSLVSYKNINTIYLRLIIPDKTLKEQLKNQYNQEFWPALTGANPLKKWKQPLPITNDLQQHSAEIKIDGLPAGEYVLIASDKEDFDNNAAIMGARLFYVSSISYITSGDDYFLLDRDNGQPLNNATVQVWEQQYNYKTSRYSLEKGKTFATDKNGFFKLVLPPKKEGDRFTNYSYLLDISYKNDRLYMDDIQYSNQYYSNQKKEEKTVTQLFLFTDRAIYRPGQTVFFKGIVLDRNEVKKTAAVKSTYKTTIVLKDANNKEIDSLQLQTNEFGSITGKFQLPQSGLNGQFQLFSKKDGGYNSIRVEEYKRPKFYVDYEPVKGTYKVNDSIEVTGFAKAYAGNTIDGAMVKYRVVRNPRFIYPWLFWRWWQPPAEQMEITNGETRTDKDGKFSISFTAIPDLKIEQKFEPVFDYTVYADITDINGETRTGEKTVAVSYQSLMLVTKIPETLPADSFRTLSIRTQNMNGEFEPAIVTVTISRLQQENRLIRKRYWERPDQFTMTRPDYIQSFPYDEYDNETDFKSWGKNEEVLNQKDSVYEQSNWSLKNKKFNPGYYEIEIKTTDKNGQPIKDIRYIELTDNQNQLNRPSYLWTGNITTTIEPGEVASINLGSSADQLFVVQKLSKDSVNYSYFALSKEKKKLYFPVTETDRGGFGVGWVFIKHNRVYQVNELINVPWTNKDLSIEYASYREKTLPGSEEKWKLKISGAKNEKVAAELLAGMYDASLDQFVQHNWYKPPIWQNSFIKDKWNTSLNFGIKKSHEKYIYRKESEEYEKTFDELFKNLNPLLTIFSNYIHYNPYGSLPILRNAKIANGVELDTVPFYDIKSIDKVLGYSIVSNKISDENKVYENVEINLPDGRRIINGRIIEPQTINILNNEIKTRKNFNETAFFFPDLKTDSTGSIEFSFTMPEALTQWKFMALAHTKEAAFGLSTKEIITQKELMVQPNAPRFLREGDKLAFPAKIVNLSDKELTGTASLELFDAETNEPVDGWFQNMVPNQYFTIEAGQSQAILFPIEVPYLFNKAITWRVVAKAGNYSDGEENSLPVLSNRMLVTETMPLPMKGYGTQQFNFDKLVNSENSESLQHHALTVEYTSNPAWYAIQALPYLMEYPYECAEQNWNRYYANALAMHIVKVSPRIQQVFAQWKIKDTTALLSNLQKNQELKAVLLEETPWVLAATDEATQKRNIALLFDLVKMSAQLNNSLEKLKQLQSSNGGFVWFKGGPDDRYITQYIMTGIGHLKKINALTTEQTNSLNSIIVTAIPYLDKKIKEDYDQLIKSKTDLKKYVPGSTIIQYLYIRSFFTEMAIPKSSVTAYTYFRSRIQQKWVSQSIYMKGMIALSLYRTGDKKTTAAILKSLKETAIYNEETGMYWKGQQNGWFWTEAPIETNALLIEAFQEAGKDSKTVDQLRTWLLKNKQTSNWKTTKATAEACYALLLQGTDWLSASPMVDIQLGKYTRILSSDADAEAGTGYFKKSIEGKKVNAEMGHVSVTIKPTEKTNLDTVGSTTWGSIYWQYFEDLDKITVAVTPLQLTKKLFVESITDRGPVITPINEGDVIKVGDKVKVRIELQVDREMEYVHMKDMRASSLEQVNVLSGYNWQGGLGYYETTKDASTNFFFNKLTRGTYVFEYTLYATHTGEFSNGVTTIQCMYAPEFTAHSEGVRITVE